MTHRTVLPFRLLAVWCALALANAFAGEPSGTGGAQLMTALPSKPGPHIAKIAALNDGAWLNLGQPAPDPQWGPGWGRAYTPKMACAPDLGGAFLHGQGVHGFVKKPQNRVMDDTWFYDLNAHRWICCDPGTCLDTLDKDWKLNGDGFIALQDGQTPPITGMVHGYSNVAYSPELKQFMTYHGVGYTVKEVGAMQRKLLPDKAKFKDYCDRGHPYFFDCKTGLWSRVRVAKTIGDIRIYGATTEWFPTKKVFALYQCGGGFHFFDSAQKTWTEVKPEGPSPNANNYEGVSCYDTKRNRLCIFNRAKDGPGKFGLYDVDANRWIAPKDDFRPDEAAGGQYQSNGAFAHYDAANDAVVVFVGGKTKPGAYVYHPAEDKWDREPAYAGPHKGRNAFYDPNHNVHVFFEVEDSRTTPGNIWVWRYKKAK